MESVPATTITYGSPSTSLITSGPSGLLINSSVDLLADVPATLQIDDVCKYPILSMSYRCLSNRTHLLDRFWRSTDFRYIGSTSLTQDMNVNWNLCADWELSSYDLELYKQLGLIVLLFCCGGICIYRLSIAFTQGGQSGSIEFYEGIKMWNDILRELKVMLGVVLLMSMFQREDFMSLIVKKREEIISGISFVQIRRSWGDWSSVCSHLSPWSLEFFQSIPGSFRPSIELWEGVSST